MENNKEIFTQDTDTTDTQPAFKDFKASVSKEEFEAVLSLAESEYSKISKLLIKREKAIISASNPPEDIGPLPPGLFEKLGQGFMRRADKDFVINFSEEFARANIIVDFINRFRHTDDQLNYHNLSFIKNIEK